MPEPAADRETGLARADLALFAGTPPGPLDRLELAPTPGAAGPFRLTPGGEAPRLENGG